MAANHSRTYGTLASLLQVIGVFIYTYVSPLIGLAFHIASGALWMLEGLATDVLALDPSFASTKAKLATLKLEFNTFWVNLRLALAGKKSTKETSTLFASIFAIVGAILMMVGLFVATGPLGWAIAGCGILSGIFWYMSAQNADNTKSAPPQNMNKLAAGFQIICALCFAATLGLALISTAPAIVSVIGILGAIALSTAIASAITWMFSYFFSPDTRPVNTAPVETTEKVVTKENLFKPNSTSLIQYRQNTVYDILPVELSEYATTVQSRNIPRIYQQVDPRYHTVKSVFTDESSSEEARQLEIAKACITAAQKLCGKSSICIDGTDLDLLKAAIKVCRQNSIPFTMGDTDTARLALSQANRGSKTNTQNLSSSDIDHSMTQPQIYSRQAVGN